MSGFFAPQYQNSLNSALSGQGVSSGGSSGGASAPASAPASPAAAPAPRPPAGGLLTFSCQVVYGQFPGLMALPSTVNRAPAYRVTPGQIVTVSPLPSNVGNLRIGLRSPNAAVFGPYIMIAPSSQPVQLSVDNISEIYISGATVGDIAVITVRQG